MKLTASGKKRGRPKGSKNKVLKNDKPSKHKVLKLTVDWTNKGLGLVEYKVFEDPTPISELQRGDRVILADGDEGEFVCITTDACCTIRKDNTKLYSIRNESIRKKIRNVKNESV